MADELLEQIASADNLNAHQHFWDLSQSGSIEGKDNKACIIIAALLGHYQALASCTEDEQTAICQILKIHHTHLSWYQVLKQSKKDDEASAFRQEIFGALQSICNQVITDKQLPDLAMMKQNLTQIKPPSGTLFARIIRAIGRFFSKLPQIIYGHNDFLSIPAKKTPTV